MFIMNSSSSTNWWFALISLYILAAQGLSHHHGHQHLHHIRHLESVESLSQRSNSDSSITEGKLTSLQVKFASSGGQTGGSSSSSTSNDFTCSAKKECSNGACCGKDGWCGYGPTYCGNGCQSNCKATAECGKYAAVAGTTCPLNVCCSEFGFCGTTSEFCLTGKCQSNCQQPKPKSSGSNVQKRIVGYWEAWNSDHACGTMNPSEIPVQMLTHLNVAFGYINSAFKVTNMDGVSPEIYRAAANVKSINPDVKVSIALGGWSFSDPGPWQSIFPTMVSSSANRKKFITNLMGFLSEYGYDGVDFDWEYPGAEDRGGSDVDGKNFTALLKELRAAIKASGREYLVTFTAPSSFWYLRHFDIKNMEAHVDWINLMTYDLHGVWDSNNPIGSKVLAHTNLTEIDLALDLFWRVSIDPAKIVLGLGFYGRSFELSSSSCWKPGCQFSGPGSQGKCTASPGILSYREIKTILARTQAKAYFDKRAAVKYLVYDSNSWISYDDAETFKMKIDYANKIGLGGLMIWAIDQDDAALTALSSVTNSKYLSKTGLPFTLVELKKLFPKEYLPNDNKNSRYGLVNFGSRANAGVTDPSKTPFAFFLVAGESHAVSKLKRHDDGIEPFTFLDCPQNVLDEADDKVQTARVVCLSEDVEGCFRVMERGVEGTLVEMPDNCAPGTFARAVSLNESADQTLPYDLQDQATSAVFDFTFDYNFKLTRRDTEKTSIRLDYSNIPGYWDTIVDADGIQSSDKKGHQKRFFGANPLDWVYEGQKANTYSTNSLGVQKDLTQLMYWDTVAGCAIDGQLYGEALGAYIEGEIKVQFSYAFSLLAHINHGNLVIDQSYGVLVAQGYTDLTYTIGGAGRFDISKARNGNPSWYEGHKEYLSGSTIHTPGNKGWAMYSPYIKVDYMMASIKGDHFSDSEVEFSGLLSARVNNPINIQGTYPSVNQSSAVGDDHAAKISIPANNVMYSASSGISDIALSCYVSLGMDVDFSVPGGDLGITELVYSGPDFSLRMESSVEFETDYDPKHGTCVDYTVASVTRAEINKGGDVGYEWSENDYFTSYADVVTPSGEGLCYPDPLAKRTLSEAITAENETQLATRESHESTRSDQVSVNNNTSNEAQLATSEPHESTIETQLSTRESHEGTLQKRAKGFPGWGWVANEAITAALIFRGKDFNHGVDIINHGQEKVKCAHCLSCTDEDQDDCCGCVNMDVAWGYRDITPCEECDEVDESGAIEPRSIGARAIGKPKPSKKSVSICRPNGNKQSFWLNMGGKYPPFPKNPSWPWDGIQNGLYDPISRYWGNDSAICSDWTVSQSSMADHTAALQRREYNTEHVFEGQLIGDFFNEWLETGMINNQQPQPANPTQIFSCAQTNQYVTSITTPTFTTQGKPGTFLQYILSELGSLDHLDRLTIYLGRPNRMKGTMFTGNKAVADVPYKMMTAQEQLAAVKEMGMMFEYLRHQEIWDKFCGTYEAIYTKMGEFDTWLRVSHGQGYNLQAEWKKYIRVVLDSLVLRSRSHFDNYYALKTQQTVSTEFHWAVNKVANRRRIKITQLCRHMDPSTVPI
ncbi:glycoside hydrolase family 18 protein [Astrocystis sublimbata]|nr:glycoside hydrolase family 18 protein [Astrocystis sublimbata]